MNLLERLPKTCWPEFIRGDCDWGTDGVMTELEQAGCDYLFKMKKTANVKKAFYHGHCSGEWTRCDRYWEGKESELKLDGWVKPRRIIIVRRRLPGDALLLEKENKKKQKEIAFLEGPENIKLFEYSVLVSSLDDGVITIIDHYRDRADCENNFDEIKNQWGWGGYTTQDSKRCRLISRMVALAYNGWTLFVRLSHPDSHKESITSRPLLMSAIGKLTESGRQKK